MMLPGTALLLAGQTGLGKIVDSTYTFKTAHYTLTITTHCGEHETGCDNVTHKSLSTTGKSITLHGRENLRMCAGDPQTPCGFNGYSFRNGSVESTVPQDGIDGDLIVWRGTRVVFSEKGTWTDPQ